jgi:biotin transport system substrate-specific component
LTRPDTATLRWAVLPGSGLLTDVLLVGGGAGFTALAAQVSFELPGTPVPITGQTFAVLLVGATLGALLALASLGLYLFVGALGAPIYADGNHGWEVLTGPTGGYIIGFVLAATTIGFLAQRRWDRRFSSAVATMLTGNVVIYLFGLPWLAADQGLGFEETMKQGLAPFVVGDVLKLYLAAALLPAAWRLVERFRG